MENSEKFLAVVKKVIDDTKFEAGKNYALHLGITQGEVEVIKLAVLDALPQFFNKPVLTSHYMVEQRAFYVNFIKPSDSITEFSLRVEQGVINCLTEYAKLIHDIVEMCSVSGENLSQLLPTELTEKLK